MKSENFKIGLRVKCITQNDGCYGIINQLGTLIAIDDIKRFGVVFDKKIIGCHSLQGKCERGYGFWIPSEKLEFVNVNRRII